MINSSCLTCRASFENPALQRDHYKSEWHRYNLKRKILNLFPIDYEIFLSKSKLSGQIIDETESLYCKACNKGFLSKNSYDTHVKSKKHLNSVQINDKNSIEMDANHVNKHLEKLNIESHEAGRKLERLNSEAHINVEIESIASEKSWSTLSSSQDHIEALDSSLPEHINKNQHLNCLFCTCSSDTTSENLFHMQDHHGFFIPYESKVVNIDGYLNYLAYKLNFCNICLWCNRNFTDTLSCQKHITDKGHFKLQFERDDSDHILEYLQFYCKKNLKDITNNTAKLSKALDRIFVPIIQITTDDKDLFKPSINGVSSETYEMALPNGNILGHRSLNVYYKQKLSSYGKGGSSKKSLKMQRLFASAHLSHLVATQYGKKLTKRDIKRDRMNFIRPYKAYQRRQLKIMEQANNQAHFRQQVDF